MCEIPSGIAHRRRRVVRCHLPPDNEGVARAGRGRRFTANWRRHREANLVITSLLAHPSLGGLWDCHAGSVLNAKVFLSLNITSFS
jgi:hypothetical protein